VLDGAALTRRCNYTTTSNRFLERERDPMKKVRKLYESPNGDRWYLIRDPSGTVFVRHEANGASGGQVTHVGIAAFLSSGDGPEHQELLRLIGTLVDEQPVHGPAFAE
jgi:hypothetical protein